MLVVLAAWHTAVQKNDVKERYKSNAIKCPFERSLCLFRFVDMCSDRKLFLVLKQKEV